jgi:2-polyprenyl-6-methoxyphenol hydroxylase-like FAD-dependent oxidoreductase
MKRHAEIAGGGIGGLSLGMMLRKRDWSVVVHERSPEIRELGAGIYIKNNSLSVLEEFGVYDKLAPRGTALTNVESRDHLGNLFLSRNCDTNSTRMAVFARQALIEELRDAALAAGVHIRTNSLVSGADPQGALLMADGTRRGADLVVGCDGFNSKVRASIAPNARAILLNTSINRYLLPNRKFARNPVTVMYYAGQRRIGIAPSGDNLTFVFTVCPYHDERARLLPLDRSNWERMYPNLGDLFAELADSPATFAQYCLVRTPIWQKGRVAIVGDAATGLPPTLGQGAGLTIMNARALVEALDQSSSVLNALPHWESATRFLSDMTQNWSLRWDWISRTCPSYLAWIKPIAYAIMRAAPSINGRIHIADRGMGLLLDRVRAA